MWLAFFCQPAYKINRKHKTFKLIAPKPVKIDMSCKNKKFLNLIGFQILVLVFLIIAVYFEVIYVSRILGKFSDDSREILVKFIQ